MQFQSHKPEHVQIAGAFPEVPASILYIHPYQYSDRT